MASTIRNYTEKNFASIFYENQYLVQKMKNNK